MAKSVETIVVGGGQAGLAASYYLSQAGRPHFVLERSSQAAHAWRKERWDSFTLVTPNWTLRMPGAEYAGESPDGFLTRQQVVDYFEAYIAHFGLPMRFGVEVQSVERSADRQYVVKTNDDVFLAANVIIATGLYQQLRLPGFATQLPAKITQLHSSQYRHPEALPAGAVLVVGAGQSGAQIVEELYQSGRKVFLSVGRTARVPRRYRGRDTYRWVEALGLIDRTVDQLKSPREKFEVNPTVSGKDGGRTLNLHQFARDGVVLLGRLTGVEVETLVFGSTLKDDLSKADQFEANVVQAVDKHISENCLNCPAEQLPHLRDGFEAPDILRLNPVGSGIASVIWATGYTFDFSLVRLPVCDEDGYPIQKRGVTTSPGLYFLGLPWLHTQKSGLIFGVGEDAAHVVSHLLSRTEASDRPRLQ